MWLWPLVLLALQQVQQQELQQGQGLQLDVALEGHVRYHYADVFGSDVLVVVKVIPVQQR